MSTGTEWAKENPDKVRAAKLKYRQSPRGEEKERQYRREYRQRPEVKERMRDESSSEERLAWRREYRRKSAAADRVKNMLARLRQRAKARGLEMSLTREDLEVPERCPVLGVALDWDDKWRVPSVDRLDNARGYVRGNVRVISRRANALKSDATVAEIESVLNYMRRENCP